MYAHVISEHTEGASYAHVISANLHSVTQCPLVSSFALPPTAFPDGNQGVQCRLSQWRLLFLELSHSRTFYTHCVLSVLEERAMERAMLIDSLESTAASLYKSTLLNFFISLE